MLYTTVSELVCNFKGMPRRRAKLLNSHGRIETSHSRMIVIGIVNYFRTVDPHIPYNSGLVRPIDVIAPRGSLVNPESPAACAATSAVHVTTTMVTARRRMGRL